MTAINWKNFQHIRVNHVGGILPLQTVYLFYNDKKLNDREKIEKG